MAQQGLFYFAGVRGLFSATFTLSPGITPSVCTMTVAPVSGVLRQGALTISYGGQTLTFGDCIIDKIDATVDDSGFTTWQLSILDRRWRWQGSGRISGAYNVRRDGQAEPIEETKKKPQELAKLCLDALGERGADVSGLPNDVYPEVDWDYEKPAEALATLCDKLGCRVVLRSSDRVAIERTGAGSKLPRLSTLRSYTETIDPPEAPGELVVVGARTRYQMDFELEAVGVEADGEIKVIDQLSYKPAEGWGNTDPKWFNNLSDATKREQAKESVFRWYRIKTPFKMPDGKQSITTLDRVLPIESKQIETKKIVAQVATNNRVEPLPAYVYGIFYSRLDGAGAYYSRLERNVAASPYSKYPDELSFTVDTEQGIVKFSDPVYRLTIDDTIAGGSFVEPAYLILRTAASLRDEKTRGWEREEFSRRIGGSGPTRFVLREDLIREVYTKWTGQNVGTVVDNRSQILRQAERYLDQEQLSYQALQPVVAQYEGFVDISPSGTVSQVTWAVNDEGLASTRAAYGTEEILVAPTAREKRNIEQIKRVIERQKIARVEEEDRRKGRA